MKPTQPIPTYIERVKAAWKEGMLYEFYSWLFKKNKEKETKENADR